MTVIDYNIFFLASIHQHEGQSKSVTQPLHDYSKYLKPKCNENKTNTNKKNLLGLLSILVFCHFDAD